jgi:hypothetical protein
MNNKSRVFTAELIVLEHVSLRLTHFYRVAPTLVYY